MIPSLQKIFDCNPVNILSGCPAPDQVRRVAGSDQRFTNFGDILTAGLNLTFLIAGVLLLIWISWGIFEYIFAGGDKEKLGKARNRITWAIVGFLITILSFTIFQYLQQIFPVQQIPNVKEVRPPTP